MFAGAERTVSVDYSVYRQLIATDRQVIVLPANVNDRQVIVKRYMKHSVMWTMYLYPKSKKISSAG